MSDPNDLAAFLDAAWAQLCRGLTDSTSPARYPTFATVSPDGLPEARTVALRHAAQAEAVLEVHTDIATAKITSLKSSPRAALHFWIPEAQLQVRLLSTVTILCGEAVEKAWTQVPPASRISYGTRPDPGLPIGDAHAYEKPPVRDRFAVLRCVADDIDLVELGEKHRRAGFCRADNWQGSWLAP